MFREQFWQYIGRRLPKPNVIRSALYRREPDEHLKSQLCDLIERDGWEYLEIVAYRRFRFRKYNLRKQTGGSQQCADFEDRTERDPRTGLEKLSRYKFSDACFEIFRAQNQARMDGWTVDKTSRELLGGVDTIAPKYDIANPFDTSVAQTPATPRTKKSNAGIKP